jgi:peptidoglycan/LPS O-acetylase OafA/YrhL
MNPFINRLRGLLAMGVVSWHIVPIASMVPITADAWQNVFGPLALFSGFNYVIGFIVVSGYCIARSTLRRDFTIARYTALRITRIYPTLIACACVAGAVEFALYNHPSRIPMWSDGITVHNFAVSLLGMSGFYGQFGSYAPTYTVSYELLYYLIWGVAFAVVPTRFAVPISAVIGLALYFVLPGEYHFALVLFGVWLFGAALAVHEREILAVARYVPIWLMWALILWAYVNWNVITAPLGSLWNAPNSLSYLPLGLLFTVVMACHLSKHGPAMQLDDWLGNISYPLFLVHGPILIAVGSALKASGLVLPFGALAAACFGCSVLVAHAVYVLIERPILRKRAARLTYRFGFVPSTTPVPKFVHPPVECGPGW